MTDSSQPKLAPSFLKEIERLAAPVAEKTIKRCEMLNQCSDDATGLTRVFCSPAMKQAHQLLDSWFQACDLVGELDAVGNLIGRPAVNRDPATNPGKSLFLIGSHLDTVVNAGRFDGALGVLLGLGVVEIFQAANIDLGFEIHVVGFSEEEGVRYKLPFIGSQGLAGSFSPSEFARTDDDETSLFDALDQFGCDPKSLASASYQAKEVIGFLEPHIEQATVLEEAGIPVGVVSAIAGQTRATIVIQGQAGHAGTVPHHRRRDALAAASELILSIERLGQQTDGLFATIGNVAVTPGLSNVICGRAVLRLDLRHALDQQRERAFEKIQTTLSKLESDRGITVELESVQHSPAVPMDDTLTCQLALSIEDWGLESKKLVSGAGHDAMIMSNLAPSCMLFIRCRDGISHHPDEFVSEDDVRIALQVMVKGLLNVAKLRGSKSSRA